MGVRRVSKKKKIPGAFFYYKYPKYEEVIRCYLTMMERSYPNKVIVETIGKSFQGRDINMIKISKGKRRLKDVVLIDAGIHAREWLSHTTALYVIDYILRKPGILNLMDFYIIPCLNPDGYVYSHEINRLWRKNLNTNNSSKTEDYGVDLNRNFPLAYGRGGSSDSPSSYMYRGKYPLSEPEAKALAQVMGKYKNYIKLYISIHCYGNVLLYPWGYTCIPVCDRKDLETCGRKALSAMKLQYGLNKFKLGSTAKLMYITSGSSSDYAKGTIKIKFSYTIELQRGGKSGFTPSSRKILCVAQETTTGILAMVKYVHKYYNTSTKKKIFGAEYI